ncbi:MAG TPA: hypothetical protein VMU36_10035 [Spirochaetia bacterium]|nr:hypothetical protein [Spirochaetia bacterium]
MTLLIEKENIRVQIIASIGSKSGGEIGFDLSGSSAAGAEPRVDGLCQEGVFGGRGDIRKALAAPPLDLLRLQLGNRGNPGVARFPCQIVLVVMVQARAGKDGNRER